VVPLIRSFVYASLFVAFVLVFIPARLIELSGVTRPSVVGSAQIAGGAITAVGVIHAFWCVVTFALMGRGTPAPFDPPRRLVVAGPYRWVRNPMYIGAGLALIGASLFYWSLAMITYSILFFIIAHIFVILYEEPILKRTFGLEYEVYCRRVRRWLPGRS